MANLTGCALLSDVELTTKLTNMVPVAGGEWQKCYYKWYIDSSKSHGGSFSLALRTGGVFDIDYGCDAGAKTIKVWVWAPTNHKVKIKVIHPETFEVVAEEAPSSTEQWEEVSLSFMAEKKVYIVRMMNCTIPDGNKTAWFDDVQ
jgi:hypothetical protein